MRLLVFTHHEERLKCDVRAAMLHKYLEERGRKVVYLNDFNYREINLRMLRNYFKLILCLLTKRKDDVVVFENERSTKLLGLFKSCGYKLALDIMDNKALQHSAYKVKDTPKELNNLEKLLLRNIEMCNYVFAVSESCKKLYPEKYEKRIFVVENASDPSLFEFTELPERSRVGFISGIAPGRGIELLIQAMQVVKETVPGVELAIAGDAQEETIRYYAELKRKFRSDWISFYDDVYYGVNAKHFFQECYLTVIPHLDHIHYHTTLPVKLFDSLACGRPVVATNCEETSRILHSYECGLVADFSAKDLAGKILELLTNRALAKRMGANGRRVVEEIYNWNNMAKKIIDILSR